MDWTMDWTLDWTMDWTLDWTMERNGQIAHAHFPTRVFNQGCYYVSETCVSVLSGSFAMDPRGTALPLCSFEGGSLNFVEPE